jgi:hypothetical protein
MRTNKTAAVLATLMLGFAGCQMPSAPTGKLVAQVTANFES